ncbi:hypothetical protein K9K77_03125 [Candidatus Babeliales bacterium]|nr:hypothetical protein [Candidatus Babeliales bacterium]
MLYVPEYGIHSKTLSIDLLRLRASGIDWKLPEEEQEELKLDWLRNSIDHSNAIEKRFLEELI